MFVYLLLFLVGLAALVYVGRLCVKSMKKKQIAEREAQLRIAMGDFGDIKTVVKRKKLTFRKIHPLSVEQIKAANKLSALVEELLRLTAVYENEQTPRCMQSLEKVSAAQEAMEKQAPLHRYSAKELMDWFNRNTKLQLALEQAKAENDADMKVLSEIYVKTMRAWVRVSDGLSNLTKSLVLPYPEELAPVLTIAQRVCDGEIQLYNLGCPFRWCFSDLEDEEIEKFRRMDSPKVSALAPSQSNEVAVPSQPDEIKDLATPDVLVESLPKLFAAAAISYEKFVVAKAASNRLNTAWDQALPAVPEKPTDAEVQKFLTAMRAWAVEVDSCRQEFAVSVWQLLRLQDDVGLAVIFGHKVLDELGALASSAAISAQAGAAKATQKALERMFREICSWLTYITTGPVVVDRLGVSRRPTPEHAPANFDAALRKLSFALAQEEAAGAKLKQFKAHQIAEPATKPTLDQPSVEAFIQAHERWIDSKEKAELEQADRTERFGVLEAQLQERTAQAHAAALVMEDFSEYFAAHLPDQVLMQDVLEQFGDDDQKFLEFGTETSLNNAMATALFHKFA